MVDLASWRWVFGALGPIALGLFLFGKGFLKEGPPAEEPNDDGPLDMLGAPMGAVAVGLIVAVLLKGSAWGWTSAAVLGALAAGVALAYGVVVRSRTHPAPLLDLSLFSIRRFAVAASLVAVFNMATTGYWFAAPIFLQEIWGWSILASGLAIAPGPLTHLAFAKPAGRWADEGHHRALLIVGASLGAISMGMMAWRLTESGNYWTDLFPWTLLVGVSGAMAWATFTSAALVDVDEERYGQANGIALTVRQMGAALGVAMVIAVIGDSALATANDFRWAFAALMTACIICAGGFGVAVSETERHRLRRHNVRTNRCRSDPTECARFFDAASQRWCPVHFVYAKILVRWLLSSLHDECSSVVGGDRLVVPVVRETMLVKELR